MHYLIDGHNLIAQIPDIELQDPNDEAKLVLRLRSWAAVSAKRQVTVIFDRGLPGGEWRRLSRGRVKAVFASGRQTADDLLVKKIRSVRNPSGYTVVTSDRAITAQAKAYRLAVINSVDFAQKLNEVGNRRQSAEKSTGIRVAEEPFLSQEELDEWLDIFGSSDQN